MSDASASNEGLAAEFEVLAKRAGLDVPEARKPAMLLGYQDLKRMTALMRQPRTGADEPAGTYSILTITRSV